MIRVDPKCLFHAICAQNQVIFDFRFVASILALSVYERRSLFRALVTLREPL